MNDTTSNIPADLAAEAAAIAVDRDETGALAVEVRPAESDLPGFDYFELFTVDTSCPACGAAEGESHGCTLEERSTTPTERRIGGRLVLTLATGCQVELDAEETADVMWALANATRRNRKAKLQGNSPDRAARFERQQALMAKIADSPA